MLLYKPVKQFMEKREAHYREQARQAAEKLREVKARELEAQAQAKEELPAREPKKAAAIIALILLGSVALGIGGYLVMKRKDED